MTNYEEITYIIMLICIIFKTPKIIGTWKILTKANKPGWGALIPFYNEYLLCQITGVNPLWIIIVLCAGILSFIPIIGSLLSSAASIYFEILLNVSLARSFSKEDSYAVGLILLAPIFYLILGTKDNNYLGTRPMDDVVFNKINQITNNNGTKTNTENYNVKYCSSCGTQITHDTKYCPNCGKEI